MLRSPKWQTRLQIAVGKRRYLKKTLGFLLPEILGYRINPSFQIFLDPKDLTGPSYYVLFGGPEAYYHYEQAEKKALLEAIPENGVFLDVGANVGLFSFFVSEKRPGAQVFAFEPHPKLFQCLQATCSQNPKQNVTATQACLGSQNGEIELFVNRKDSGGHSTRKDQIRNEDHAGAVRVPLMRLDDFVLEKGIQRLDALKIDVQGAEWEVLEGARDSIRRFKPTILIELDHEQVLAEPGSVQAYFKSLSLETATVKRPRDTSFVSLSELDRLLKEEMALGHIQANYVLLTRENS